MVSADFGGIGGFWEVDLLLLLAVQVWRWLPLPFQSSDGGNWLGDIGEMGEGKVEVGEGC